MPQYQGVWSLQQQMQALTSGQWATDPLFDYTTLLLQADNAANSAQNNTFLDSSTNAFAITRNGNTTQGTFSPFSLQPGAWGNYFDGSSSYFSISTSSTTLAFGTGDFTIEGFFFFTSTPQVASNPSIVGSQNGGFIGWRPTTTGIEVYTPGVGNAVASDAFVIPTNQWIHMAVVRESSSMSFYMNGTRQGAAKTNTNNYAAPSSDITIARTGTGGPVVAGYISNLRIVKGRAVYSGSTYAVPNNILGTTSGGVNPPQGTETSLLTCQSNRFVDNSANNFTLATGGTPSVQAFSPFAPQFQYTASVTGGSGYFDGTTDYLTTPTGQTALTLGTGNFTIELWFYPTTQVNTLSVLYSSTSTASYTNGILVQLQSSTTLDVYMGGSAIKSAITFVPNSWNHLVVQRSATSTMSIWMNGASVSSVSTSSADLSTNSWQLSAWTSSSHHYTGYMSSFRITKGGALYSGSTITLPTAPLTTTVSAGTANLLLNFTNAGILDGTMKNNLETVGGASVSTSVVKYGSGSLSFDGSGDSLTAPSVPLFNYGSANFTVELWIYLNAAPSNDAGIIDQRPTSTNGNYFMLGVNSSRQLFIYVNSVYRIGGSASTVLNLNTWTHVSYVRFGATGTLYINGSSVGTWADSTTYLQSPMTIGRHTQGGSDLNAYMDDLRITNGFARYTQNFIPPSVALPRQ